MAASGKHASLWATLNTLQPQEVSMRFSIGHRTAIFSLIGIALFALIGNANASNRITGTLTLMPQKIRLPDIDMVLRDAVTQQEVAKSRTYLDGKFSLNAPKPGT